MSYIGKVNINNRWRKVEDLIKNDDPSFSFDADTLYQFQSEGDFGARLCDVSSAPSEDYDGFIIKGTSTAIYKPSSGNSLYVKKAHGNIGLLKVSILGE